MKKFLSNKFKLGISLTLTLFSVFVMSITTFTWFQLNSKPVQTELVSASPNLTIGNAIYGYKINHTLGENGYLGSSDDVIQFGKDENIAASNHHQDTSDINFDVPENGIGYYLVKKNPGGTFKYKYTADGETYTSYSWKFTEYEQTYISRAYLDNFSVDENDTFRIMHYYFNNSKTYNSQIKIETVYPTSSFLDIDTDTGDVKCTTAGTYKIWLNFGTNELSFENVTITSNGISIRSSTALGNIEDDSVINESFPQRATTGTKNASNIKLLLIDRSNNGTNFTWSNGDPKIHFVVNEYDSEFEYKNKSYSQIASYNLGFTLGSDNNSLDTAAMTWFSSDYNLSYDGTSGDFRSYYYNFPWYIKSITYWYISGNGGYTYNSLEAVSGNDYRDAVYNTNYDSGANRGNMYHANTFEGQTISTGTNTITYNLNGGTGTTSSVFYEHQITTAPSSPTRNGYTFWKWTETNSTSANAFTFGNALTSDKTLYAQWKKNHTVKLIASYFINSVQSNVTEELSSSIVVDGNTYEASGYTDSRDYNDTVNAIHYTFSRVGTTTWYNEASCSTTWTNDSTISDDKNIYAKFNCDFTGNYTTFYIDIEDAYTPASNTQWSSVSIMYNDGSEVVIAAVKIASTLYRVTLPNTYTFRLGNGIVGDSGSGNNFTTVVENSGGVDNRPCSHANEIIYVDDSAYGSNHDFFWCPTVSTASYGTAKIYTSTDGSSWTEQVTMYSGDDANNYFIYEQGLQIPTNTFINVVVTGSSVISNTDYGLVSNNKYLSTNDKKYIDSTSSTYIKTTNYTNTARFNFYLTHNGYLSIAMVPDYGNGYYIMSYDSTYGTNNYINSIKMTTNSDSKATYEYFYATEDKEIFIRSYLDAQDTLINTNGSLPSGVYLGTSNGTTATEDGVIHFSSAGYYNITVENNKIYIEQISNLSSSFKLNKLDTSKVNSAYAIWKQKTSLVLEIPFTAVNDYASTISLNVQNSLNKFVGVSLYVSDTQLDNPYTFMRGESNLERSEYYNHLSNESIITDRNNLEVKSESAEDYYYAYILVDYLPVQTNSADYKDDTTGLAGNSAYSGSTCESNIYSSTSFISTNPENSITYYLVATQKVGS